MCLVCERGYGFQPIVNCADIFARYTSGRDSKSGKHTHSGPGFAQQHVKLYLDMLHKMFIRSKIGEFGVRNERSLHVFQW